MVHLDTHVVVWLYMGDIERLSSRVKDLMEKEELVISPIVSLELTFLHEIDRLSVDAAEVIGYLGATVDLVQDGAAFAAVVAAAARFNWTRDPFDRLIVAQSQLSEAPLITKDRHLLDHYPHAIW